MTILPNQLIALLETARSRVQHDDPLVYPTPQMRKAVYAALAPYHAARVWQGILAARRVLPIFHRAFPHESLPTQMVETAEGVLHGTISNDEARAVWSEGYHTVGGYWADDDEYIAANAHLVGQAAFRALSGVWGYYFLDDLDTSYGRRRVTEMGEVSYELIMGNAWTNELVFQFSCTDTVLAAAAALARNPTNGQWHRDTLREFWTWWLHDAIPAAVTQGA